MAASSATAECKDKDDDALTTTLHTCANDPDFAVICAFMQKFAKDLGLALPNFKHLQEWLTNNDEGTFACSMYVRAYKYICMQLCVRVPVCVCAYNREKMRERERERDRERAFACLYYCLVWSKAETVKIVADKRKQKQKQSTTF